MQQMTLTILAVALLAAAGCSRDGHDTARNPAPAAAPATAAQPAAPAVDGRIENGLRVLTFDPARPGARYTIYRGDYVRPELAGSEAFAIVIPALGVDLAVPAAEGAHGYFKVPDAGVFAFTIGELGGEIEALEFTHAAYSEVSAREAAGLLEAMRPFLLDVRTRGEFDGGHIEGATLVPVQELARRIGELQAHREDPVLVYCATGNRSTVAAKLLTDAGFERVINLRRGIREWADAGLPVVR